MQQIPTITPQTNAYLGYLESRGLYSAEASNWAQSCGSDVHVVCVPVETWMRFVNVVGMENVRDLLSVVLGEYCALNDHWALTNYYRAITSGCYAISDTLDLFMDLEDGHRKNAAIAFVRRYKANVDNSLETTAQALGVFSSLLIATSSFFTEVLAMLSQYQRGYYTKAFDISIRALSDSALAFNLTRRASAQSLVAVRPLDTELGLVCSGNAALIKMFKSRADSQLQSRADVITSGLMRKLTNRSY